MKRNNILIGDALQWLKKMPDESVHCVVTSPPYYGLRDYGVAGQIGLEETPDQYIEKLVAVFWEVRRVLRSDGTCWLNMGDSYVGSTSQHKGTQSQGHNSVIASGTYASVPVNGRKRRVQSAISSGYKPKDLMMMPARLAIELQADGWWLRSDIIWHKPNPMPESVTDRPTRSHEHIFLLTKAARYFYDADAIREPLITNGNGGVFNRNSKYSIIGNQSQGKDFRVSGDAGRNKRDVWTIPTQSFPEAHFATFPIKLVEPCILAGCPETCCAECGAGYMRVAEKPTPSCACDTAATQPGIVLDPFFGAGTTAIAAIKHNRDYLGIELSIEYVGLAQKRIAEYRRELQNADPTQPKVYADGSKQLSLFDSQIRTI